MRTNRDKVNCYDYGARFYDPVIGRFTGLDPIAEDYYYVTPYNYAENSPIVNIDLWGLQAWNVNVSATLRAKASGYMALLKSGGNSIMRMLGPSTSSQMPSGVSNQIPRSTLNNIDKSAKLNAASNAAASAEVAGKQLTEDALEIVGTTGDALTVAGYAMAPFTGGASMGLVAIGETMSAVSSGGKIAVAAAEGDFKTIAIERTALLVGKGTTTLADEAIQSSVRVGTLQAGSKDEKIQSRILRAVSTVSTKSSEKASKIIVEDHD